MISGYWCGVVDLGTRSYASSNTGIKSDGEHIPRLTGAIDATNVNQDGVVADGISTCDSACTGNHRSRHQGQVNISQ